jgi:hypothetical protein
MGGILYSISNALIAESNQEHAQSLEDQREWFQAQENSNNREFQARMSYENSVFHEKIAKLQIQEQKNVALLSMQTQGKIAEMHNKMAERQLDLQATIAQKQIQEQKNTALLSVQTQGKIAEMHNKMAERQLDLQAIIAQKQLEFQKVVADNNVKMQKAIAEKNVNLQLQLSAENRELQKYLALFNAYYHRETAIMTASLTAERNYQLANLPITLIRRNFPNIEENHRLNIIFSPPRVSFDQSMQNYLSDCEGTIGSNIINFLQTNSRSDLYAYYSGAWRDPRFSGTASHQAIFSEFSSMPFLIIDCNIAMGKLNYTFSFWDAGDSSPSSFQIISNQEYTGYFNDLIRARTELFITSIYNPIVDAMRQEGRSKEQIDHYLAHSAFGADYANELYNMRIMYEESNLNKFSEGISLRYKPSKHEYDSLVEVISEINSVIAGIVTDFYHLYAGNINTPIMLKNIYRLLERIPNTENFKLRDTLRKYITDEYQNCMKQFIHKDEKGNKIVDEITPINICLELASVYSRLSVKKLKTEAIEQSAEIWCNLIGINFNSVGKILSDTEIRKNVFSFLRADKDMAKSLREIFYRADDDASDNVKEICKIYEKFGAENLKLIYEDHI